MKNTNTMENISKKPYHIIFLTDSLIKKSIGVILYYSISNSTISIFIVLYI